jgi:hypothetical protein
LQDREREGRERERERENVCFGLQDRERGGRGKREEGNLSMSQLSVFQQSERRNVIFSVTFFPLQQNSALRRKTIFDFFG